MTNPAPARTVFRPLEFPGVHRMDAREEQAVLCVQLAKLPHITAAGGWGLGIYPDRPFDQAAAEGVLRTLPSIRTA